MRETSHCRWLCCNAQFVALGVMLGVSGVLSGCESAALFARDVPESAEVAAAPWPRLVDTPAAPAPGTFSAAAPDPAAGKVITDDLAAQASAATVGRDALSGPVIDPAERARMLRRARAPRP